MVEPIPGEIDDGLANKVTAGAALVGDGEFGGGDTVGGGFGGLDSTGGVPCPALPLQAVSPKPENSMARNIRT